MAMSRKDFIEIAEGCVDAIRSGQVKKKDIAEFIRTMSVACRRCASSFDYDKFEQYIMERV